MPFSPPPRPDFQEFTFVLAPFSCFSLAGSDSWALLRVCGTTNHSTPRSLPGLVGQEHGVDDVTGEKLVRRDDDQPEVRPLPS